MGQTEKGRELIWGDGRLWIKIEKGDCILMKEREGMRVDITLTDTYYPARTALVKWTL